MNGVQSSHHLADLYLLGEATVIAISTNKLDILRDFAVTVMLAYLIYTNFVPGDLGVIVIGWINTIKIKDIVKVWREMRQDRIEGRAER